MPHIRITLKSGEVVETHQHTYEQVKAAQEAGRPIEVGGPDEEPAWVPGDDTSDRRLIHLDGADVREMSASEGVLP